jgi:hypothetical protein
MIPRTRLQLIFAAGLLAAPVLAQAQPAPPNTTLVGLIVGVGMSPEILPLETLPPVIAQSGAIVTSLLTSAAAIALFIAPLGWFVYAEMADRDSR